MSERVIVFVAYGSFGDINPLLAIARRLLPHHAVRFISNEAFRKHIEAAGVPFFPAGTLEEQQVCNTIDFSPETLMAGLMAQFRNHVGKNIPRVTAYIEQWHRAGEQLLVVTPALTNPVYPICEQLHVPVVVMYYAPSFITLNREDFVLSEVFEGCTPWKARWLRYPRHALQVRVHGPPHARQEYNRFRAAVGIGPSLPPYQRWLHRLMGRRVLRLNIAAEILLGPRWFAEPIGWGMRKIRCVGFPLLDHEHRHEDNEVDAFIARYGAPIVFAPGTGIQDIEAFCRPLGDACLALGAPGILLSKHGHETFKRLGTDPDVPIMHVEFIDDLGWLLSNARLLVHAGGIGTIAQAIRAKVVQIIRPIANDQPRNALRVLMNGLGGLLSGDAYTGEDIAATCRQLEGSELHRNCREHYGELVRGDDGAAQAAMLLAKLQGARTAMTQLDASVEQIKEIA